MIRHKRTLSPLQGPLQLCPAIMLPEQLLTGRIQPPPEQRLLIAILADAVDCFRCGDPRLCREAENWIMNDAQGQPFSFEHICLVLGLDTCAVRRALTAAARRAAKQRHAEAQPVAPGVPRAAALLRGAKNPA